MMMMMITIVLVLVIAWKNSELLSLGLLSSFYDPMLKTAEPGGLRRTGTVCGMTTRQAAPGLLITLLNLECLSHTFLRASSASDNSTIYEVGRRAHAAAVHVKLMAFFFYRATCFF